MGKKVKTKHQPTRDSDRPSRGTSRPTLLEPSDDHIVDTPGVSEPMRIKMDRKNNRLNISMPIPKTFKESMSGKSLMVGSTNGVCKTPIEVTGDWVNEENIVEDEDVTGFLRLNISMWIPHPQYSRHQDETRKGPRGQKPNRGHVHSG